MDPWSIYNFPIDHYNKNVPWEEDSNLWLNVVFYVIERDKLHHLDL